MKLRITEIFHSIQGEASSVGLPTVFVRLTGCPLRCKWCDTEYAFSGGDSKSVEDTVESVKAFCFTYDCPRVCITGGEPLAQGDACRELAKQLCDSGLSVSMETSGAQSLAFLDRRVRVVMDIKCPGSGESSDMANLQYLGPLDQLKFVLDSPEDYHWAWCWMQQNKPECEVFFGVTWNGRLTLQELADWILRDKLKVRLQVQLHKYIWGDVKGK